MADKPNPINYDAPASLFKWPSPAKRKLATGDTVGAQAIYNGTLEGCVKQFLMKPIAERSLHEIFTDRQPGLRDSILRADHILDIAERTDFPRD
jgi:hypothetical protein